MGIVGAGLTGCHHASRLNNCRIVDCIVYIYLLKLQHLLTEITGILEREQEQSVVYGSIDFGKTIVSHDKYKELVSVTILLVLTVTM